MQRQPGNRPQDQGGDKNAAPSPSSQQPAASRAASYLRPLTHLTHILANVPFFSECQWSVPCMTRMHRAAGSTQQAFSWRGQVVHHSSISQVQAVLAQGVHAHMSMHLSTPRRNSSRTSIASDASSWNVARLQTSTGRDVCKESAASCCTQLRAEETDAGANAAVARSTSGKACRRLASLGLGPKTGLRVLDNGSDSSADQQSHSMSEWYSRYVQTSGSTNSSALAPSVVGVSRTIR